MELRPLTGTVQDVLRVQQILESAADYASAIQGAPFDAQEAARTFEERPPNVGPSAKTIFGIYSADGLIGVIDLINGFPVATTALLGLLVIDRAHRRCGLGAQAARMVEDIVSSWEMCDRIRLGVVATNTSALAFWSAMGYSATGELRAWEQGTVHSQIVVMEKRLGLDA